MKIVLDSIKKRDWDMYFLVMRDGEDIVTTEQAAVI